MQVKLNYLFIILSLLSGIVFINNSNSASQARAQSADAPESLADLAVVTNEKGTATIYLADDETGAIYFYTIKPDSPSAVKFTDFQRFFKSEKFTKPSALAYHAGQLYVCDSQVPSVFAIELASGEITELTFEKPLKRPNRISISEQGVMAVGSSDSSSIIFRDLKAGVSNELKLKSQTEGPKRLLFLGSDLLFLSNGGSLYKVVGASVASGANDLEVAFALPRGKGIPEIQDIASQAQDKSSNKIILTDKKRVSLYKAGEDNILLPIITGEELVAHHRIALNDNQLLVADLEKQIVTRLPLKLVQAKLDGKPDLFNDAILSLYNKLFEKNSLPTREFTAARPYDTLEALLLAQKVIVSPLSKKLNNVISSNSPESNRLGFIICRINGWTCTEENAGELLLSKRIGEGQGLVLPDIPITSDLITKHEPKLSGKSVYQYVEEYVPVPEQRQKISARYLMENNPPYFRSLEYELTRRNYIVATPSGGNPQPGNLIKIEGNQEVNFQETADCKARWNLKSTDKPVTARNWPGKLIIKGWADYLPSESGRPINISELNKLGLDLVEVSYEDIVEEKADRLELLNAAAPPCWKNLAAGNVYLSLDAIKVSRAKFRLVTKDGALIKLKPEDFSRLGLRGEVDTEGLWSFVLNKTYYIGYRPVPWNDKPLFIPVRIPLSLGSIVYSTLQRDYKYIVKQQEPTSTSPKYDVKLIKFTLNPYDIKRGSGQDVFSVSTGPFTLPVIKWGANLILNADELGGNLSIMNDFLNKYPSVFTLSVLDNLFTPTGMASSNHHFSEFSKAEVKLERERLKELIKFPTIKDNPAINTWEIQIGIIEQSIDKLNADFIVDKDEGESVWLEKGKDESGNEVYRRKIITPEPAPPSLKLFDRNSDHGTHVSGLIAANEDSAAPGLIPNITLFHVDISGGITNDLLQEAVTGKVVIFNISQNSSADKPTPDSLKKRMSLNWGDRLFIVAAGNDGYNLNLNDITPPKPILWLGDIPNMLVVGATEPDKRRLTDYTEAGTTYRGTNYGKKYVHLFAPGRDIISSTPKNTYAKASGTSMAVPQVAAAAALLQAQGIVNPRLIKARLIYTAEWRRDYLNEVWGGFLDVQKATWEVRKNLFWTNNVIRSLYLSNDPEVRITNRNDEAAFYNPDGALIPGNDEIPKGIYFKDILRLTHMGNQQFRIIYLDRASNMRIILNAEIEGTLEYKKYDEWDEKSLAPTKVGEIPKDDKGKPVKRSLHVLNIVDYVKGATQIQGSERIEFK